MEDVVTKAEFARLSGVTRGRVSQWIRAGQLSGDALVAAGRSEKINIAIARRQLGRRLDVDQRLSATSAVAGDTLDAIQRARLRQLEQLNAKADEEALVRSGKYIDAADARREMGAIAGRLVAGFEGLLLSFADAIAAGSSLPQRDALRLLRGVWRDARARLVGVEEKAAIAEPELVEAVR